MQLNGKRLFVHEHSERSRAWDRPEVIDFMLKPNDDSTVLHMCAFGMTAKDEQGEALVQKATRVMSSSDEVIKQVTLQCSNRGGGRIHRHVHLIQGRRNTHRYIHDSSEKDCARASLLKRSWTVSESSQDL